MRSALLGLVATLLAFPAGAAAADTAAVAPPPAVLQPVPAAPPKADRPRRNIRLAVAMGTGFVAPPLCGTCDKFWGRGVGVQIEIGWTVRPDLVLSLEEAGTVIYFSDGTDGGVVTLGPSALYFFRPRSWLRAGLGLAIVDVTEDQHPAPRAAVWEKGGAGLTFGLGHDFHRAGAMSVHVEARAIAAITRNALTPSLLGVLGISWN